MYQDRIEHLKRTIKRTYKQYIGERTDGKATLADVAKFFNIPIDESRQENYHITKIDWKKDPSIELVDESNNETYVAEYTSSADLLNSFGGDTKYIRVSMNSPIKKIESLYFIDEEKPIITRMTFSNNGYSLIFEREIPNNIGPFGNENNNFTISYTIDNYQESGVSEFLLIKSAQKHDDEGIIYDFEQTFTNDNMACVENTDSQNKYTYIEEDNIMYGVLAVEQRNLNNSFSGVCFESTHIKNLEEHFPYTMSCKDCTKIKDDNVISAIIFSGNVGKGNGTRYLQIYKTENEIIGTYGIRYYNNKDISKNISSDEEFQFPILEEGKITSNEIKYLVETLQSRFNEGFIELISSDLLEFAKRIDIKNGVINEQLDPLSPRLLFDKSFEEIASIVENDKDAYFKLASEQFEAIAYQTQEKGKAKVLNPKN